MGKLEDTIEELPKHTDEISCHALNYPDSLLATGSYDKSIILWKLTTGEYLRTLLGHTRRVKSLVFSNDGVLLASGSDERTIIVWDVETGSLVHKLGPHRSCYNVLAFSEDNAWITTEDIGCFVWELQSGELLERRERSVVVDTAYVAPYYLESDFGWQLVKERSSIKEKCLLFRPPAEYGLFPYERGPILGDRAALLCRSDGRVVILDISRVMDRFMDPARELPHKGGGGIY